MLGHPKRRLRYRRLIAGLRQRAAAHGLARRGGSIVEVAAGWAVQDSPPGAAALAFAARMETLGAGDLERALERDKSLLALYNARTAVAVVPAAEAAAYGAALLPPDEEALAALIGRALPADGSVGAADAVEITGAAVREALDERVLSRDALHAELRERLPAALLPWCPGCESHHVRRWLLVTACLRGELCLAGRAGRQPAFALPDQWLGAPAPTVDVAAAQAGLAGRFARLYPPGSSAQLADWAGIPLPHAERCWARLSETPAPDGPAGAADDVRLLPAGDPWLRAPDRARIVPDPAARKLIWRAAGAPGVVLAGTTIVAGWRGRKAGGVLRVALDPIAPLDDALVAAIAAEAARIAPLRGCGTAELAPP